MIKTMLLSTLLCGSFFASFSAAANDKVETIYNSTKFQQVCKGKSQGAEVSFAYRGIIWNGTCEPQFFSSSSKAGLTGNEAELNSICLNDANVKSINIEGKEIHGKCALGFSPPRPK